MTKLFSFLPILGMVAVAPLLHADFVIAYEITPSGGPAGPVTLCADSPSDNAASCLTAGASVGGGVTLTNVSGSSNSPGAPSFSDQFGSTTTITTTGSGATIVLYFAAQDFTMPVTGGVVTGIDYASSVGVTSAEPGSSGTVVLNSCVDQSNGTVPATTPTLAIATGYCTTAAATLTNATLTVPSALGGSASNTVSELFAPLGSPYSLSQMVTVALGANSSINFSTSQDLTPVPEPISIALLGAVVALTNRAFLRKRSREASGV